jgi:hypothetical protein
MTIPKHPSHATVQDFVIRGADPRMTGRRYLAGYSEYGTGPAPIYGWMVMADGHPVDRFDTRAELVLAAREKGAAYLAEWGDDRP